MQTNICQVDAFFPCINTNEHCYLAHTKTSYLGKSAEQNQQTHKDLHRLTKMFVTFWPRQYHLSITHIQHLPKGPTQHQSLAPGLCPRRMCFLLHLPAGLTGMETNRSSNLCWSFDFTLKRRNFPQIGGFCSNLMELKHDKNKGYRRLETPPFDLINRPLMAVQSSTALNAVSHSSTAIPPYVRNKKYSNCSSIKNSLNLKQVYLLNSLVLGLSFSC